MAKKEIVKDIEFSDLYNPNHFIPKLGSLTHMIEIFDMEGEEPLPTPRTQWKVLAYDMIVHTYQRAIPSLPVIVGVEETLRYLV
ncbi:MAG: hypothetical protein WDZ77_02110 [Candidatus Pacearchaeota archaeon]